MVEAATGLSTDPEHLWVSDFAGPEKCDGDDLVGRKASQCEFMGTLGSGLKARIPSCVEFVEESSRDTHPTAGMVDFDPVMEQRDPAILGNADDHIGDEKSMMRNGFGP